jgi:hypothetical protein
VIVDVRSAVHLRGRGIFDTPIAASAACTPRYFAGRQERGWACKEMVIRGPAAYLIQLIRGELSRVLCTKPLFGHDVPQFGLSPLALICRAGIASGRSSTITWPGQGSRRRRDGDVLGHAQR